MEHLTLIEEFRAFVEASPRVPLTGKVTIHEQTISAFLDKLQACLPKSVEDAAQLLLERDRILADAAKEGEGLIEAAKEQCGILAEEGEKVKHAISQGEALIDDAMQAAKHLLSMAYSHSGIVMSILQNDGVDKQNGPPYVVQ